MAHIISHLCAAYGGQSFPILHNPFHITRLYVPIRRNGGHGAPVVAPEMKLGFWDLHRVRSTVKGQGSRARQEGEQIHTFTNFTSTPFILMGVAKGMLSTLSSGHKKVQTASPGLQRTGSRSIPYLSRGTMNDTNDMGGRDTASDQGGKSKETR